MHDHHLQHLILEAAEVSYCITDDSDNIVSISDSLAKLFDTKPADVVGKKFIETLRENLLLAPPELSSSVESVELTVFHIPQLVQLRLSRKQLSTSPPLTLYLFTDFTRQKRIEQDLDHARRDLHIADDQLQAVLDAVPAYISWVAKDGTYLASISI